MPITFNSAGGFLAGTISSSGTDIFIITSGSVGSINVGNVEYSGSQVIEKDSAGKARNKKTFNTDGTITQEKFDATQKIVETKIKNPSTGKTFRRSGSATENQIEFQQNAQGAFISVSGSTPGFNIIQTPEGVASRVRLIRHNRDFFHDGGSSVFTVGIDSSSKSWVINQTLGVSATNSSLLRVSQSGDLFVRGNIHAQEFHTQLISSSIVFKSGSTIFGDTHDDTHTFTGKFVNAITASGDISASGDIKSNKFILANGGTEQDFIHSPAENEIELKVNNIINTEFKHNTTKFSVPIEAASHITASGDISSSGTITAEHIVSSDDLNVTDRLTVSGDIYAQSDVFVADTVTHTGDTDTKMTFGTDSITFTAGNVEMLKLSEGSIGDVIVLNEGGVDVNLRVESNNNASMLFVDGGNDRIGIGTSVPGKTLEVVGDISASGDVFAHSGSFTYITASIVDVDGDTIRFGGEPFTKANIQTLKLGRSLKPPRAGRSKPDVDGDDGVFDGNITASGNIKAGGNLELTASSAGDVLKTKFVQMTNSSSVIDTFNTGSFRSVKYVLQVTSASNYQVSEMLVLHHNSTASNTEYAQINSGLNLINFSTNVNNSNVRLNANGSFISCSVRYDRTIIPI